MAVKGLESTADRYMRKILEMDFPGHHKVREVWVTISLHTEDKFVAKATVTSGEGHGKRTRGYSAVGGTIKEALLELAATIIAKYPVEEYEQVDIDLPVSVIVNTQTFGKLFDYKKGDD